MDDDLYDLLRTVPGLETSSVNNYIRGLRRVKKLCREAYTPGDDTSITSILLQPTRTFKVFENYVSTQAGSDKKSILSTLISPLQAVLKHVGEYLILPPYVTLKMMRHKWASLSVPINAYLRDVRMSGEPTEKESLALLDWATVYDKNIELRRVAMLSHAEEDVKDMILSDFYVLIDPRRVMDYWRLFVVRKVSDFSKVPKGATGIVDLTLSEPTIEILAFKTLKHEGVWKRPLPAKLVADLKLSLKLFPRSFVFMDKPDATFTTTDMFSKYQMKRLATWFGMPVTPRTLRHSRATQNVLDPTRSLKEKRLVAAAMSHSFETHMEYAYNVERAKDGSFKLSIFNPDKGRYVSYLCIERDGSSFE